MDSQRRVSGKQLTIMVVAVCAAVVLAPVGVYAASHSNVSIVDGKHASRAATVSKTGALSIAGSVKISGAPKVSLSGSPTVKTAPALQGTPYAATLSKAAGADIPAGKTFVITTIEGVEEVGTGDRPYLTLDLDSAPYSGGEEIPITMTFAKSETDIDIWEATDEVDIPVGGGEIGLSSSPSGGTADDPNITVIGYLI